MRLSEAIRIGASWSGQTTEVWKSPKGTCALGAAYEGLFGTIMIPGGYSNLEQDDAEVCGYFPQLRNAFPYLASPVSLEELPVEMVDLYHAKYGKETTNSKIPMYIPKRLYDAITSLNDILFWSREQIADWVEQLENQHGWQGVDSPKEQQVQSTEPTTKNTTDAMEQTWALKTF